MKAAILLTIAIALLAPKAYCAETSQGLTELRDVQKIDLSVSGPVYASSSKIIGTFQVNGPLQAEHCDFGTTTVMGSLIGEELTAYSLKVTGPVKLSNQSIVEDLSIVGDLSMKYSEIGKLNMSGRALLENSKVKNLEISTDSLHLWDTTVDEAVVNYYGASPKTIIIKVLGKSKIGNLTVNSSNPLKDQPIAYIILDSMTKETFNKLKATTNSGVIEYRF